MKINVKHLFHLAFTLLLVLCIYFFKERTLFADNALHIFNSINNKEIGVMAGRWPTAIVRLPLYIGIHFNVSLSFLLLLYSISHILLLYCLLSFAFLFKSKKVAILSLLTLFITLNHTFFWCVSELLPSLLIVCIIYGVSLSKVATTSLVKFNLLLLVLSCLAFFSHPLSILGVGFYTLYNYISSKKSKTLLPLLYFTILFVVKKAFISNWYDTIKMEGLKQNFQTYGLDVFKTTSFNQLLIWSKSDFLIITLAFIAAMLFLLFSKKHIKTALLLGFTCLTLGLFLLSNPENITVFYTEASLYLLSFYIGFVFVEDVFQKLTARHSMYIVGIVVLVSLTRIVYTSTFYKDRLTYLEGIANLQNSEKTAILQTGISMDRLGMDWGLPFETLLISTLLDSTKPKTVVTLDASRRYDNTINKKGIILNGIGGYYPLKYSGDYFKLTEKTYKIDSTFIYK